MCYYSTLVSRTTLRLRFSYTNNERPRTHTQAQSQTEFCHFVKVLRALDRGTYHHLIRLFNFFNGCSYQLWVLIRSHNEIFNRQLTHPAPCFA